MDDLDDIIEMEQEFVEDIFEIAFGDDAINKEYTHEEVVKKIRSYSDNELTLVETCEKLLKTIQEHREDLNNMPIEFVEGWLLQAINKAKG